MFLLYFMQINFISIKDFQKHLKNIPNPKLLIVRVYNKKKKSQWVKKIILIHNIFSSILVFS